MVVFLAGCARTFSAPIYPKAIEARVEPKGIILAQFPKHSIVRPQCHCMVPSPTPTLDKNTPKSQVGSMAATAVHQQRRAIQCYGVLRFPPNPLMPMFGTAFARVQASTIIANC